MQLAVVQAREAGLFQTLWHGSPFLSVPCWLCLLLGALLGALL